MANGKKTNRRAIRDAADTIYLALLPEGKPETYRGVKVVLNSKAGGRLEVISECIEPSCNATLKSVGDRHCTKVHKRCPSCRELHFKRVALARKEDSYAGRNFWRPANDEALLAALEHCAEAGLSVGFSGYRKSLAVYDANYLKAEPGYVVSRLKALMASGRVMRAKVGRYANGSARYSIIPVPSFF